MQFRMVVKFVNHVEALFKPIRVTFEQQADNQMYIPEYEKHTSEIAAYHVDRLVFFALISNRKTKHAVSIHIL